MELNKDLRVKIKYEKDSTYIFLNEPISKLIQPKNEYLNSDLEIKENKITLINYLSLK